MIAHEDMRKFAKAGREHILKGIADSSGMLNEFGINTPLRVSHFMAQIAHESASFRTTREYWGPTSAQKRYEGRTDLGNTRRGDGKRFMGRGLIQVTGRHNYTQFTKWAQKRYPDAPDFAAQPQELEKFPWALLSALWYWSSRNLNKPADANDLRRVTKIINGGYNGLKDRQVWFDKAWRVWGTGEKIQYAGKGKPAYKSTTNLAAGGTGVAVAVSEIADVVNEGKGLWESVKGIFTPDNWLQILLVAVIAGLLAYIIRERLRKAREFEI